eukprot:2305460-Rhodomonas_salina.1
MQYYDSVLQYPICLWYDLRYAVLRYRPMVCGVLKTALCSTVMAYSATRSCLRACYGKPGTELAYAYEQGLGAVSYTHLTLPTICSV